MNLKVLVLCMGSLSISSGVKFSDNLFALSHWHILFKSELAISMSSLLVSPLIINYCHLHTLEDVNFWILYTDH